MTGTVDVGGETIVGIITNGATLNATDGILGLPGALFSSAGTRGTLEGTTPSTQDELIWAGTAVTVTMYAGQAFQDQARIVTEKIDTDGDGVLDGIDECSDTGADAIPSPKPNHWYFDGSDFVQVATKGKGKGSGGDYTIADTRGCSCTQIVAELGLGNGHLKHGCSNSAMDEWVGGSAGKGGIQLAETPASISLDANYPNPFNPQTTIRFQLPEASAVRLAVYDVIGREISVLVDGTVSAGSHEVTFDAAGLPSGTYFYQLRTPTAGIVKFMSLAK